MWMTKRECRLWSSSTTAGSQYRKPGPDRHSIEASLNEFSLVPRGIRSGVFDAVHRDEAASPLPIDPLGFGGTAPRPSMDQEGVAAMQELARTVLSRLAETSSMEYEEHLPEVVETFVEDRLADFLPPRGARWERRRGIRRPAELAPLLCTRKRRGWRCTAHRRTCSVG